MAISTSRDRRDDAPSSLRQIFVHRRERAKRCGRQKPPRRACHTNSHFVGDEVSGSVRTLLVVRLAYERLEPLRVVDLAVGDRVELALQIIQRSELARWAVRVEPEQCRRAKRTDLR